MTTENHKSKNIEIEKIRIKKAVCLLFMLLFIWGCEKPNPACTVSFSTPLRDRNHLRADVVVEFAGVEGVTEMKKHLDRIRYSLCMVFSSMKIGDISGKGGQFRSLHAVEKILKRQLREKIVAVRFADFDVTEKTGKT